MCRRQSGLHDDVMLGSHGNDAVGGDGCYANAGWACVEGKCPGSRCPLARAHGCRWPCARISVRVRALVCASLWVWVRVRQWPWSKPVPQKKGKKKGETKDKALRAQYRMGHSCYGYAASNTLLQQSLKPQCRCATSTFRDEAVSFQNKQDIKSAEGCTEVPLVFQIPSFGTLQSF